MRQRAPTGDKHWRTLLRHAFTLKGRKKLTMAQTVCANVRHWNFSLAHFQRGRFEGIDTEALSLLPLHRVVVLFDVQQLAFQPGVNDHPALGFRLVRVTL